MATCAVEASVWRGDGRRERRNEANRSGLAPRAAERRFVGDKGRYRGSWDAAAWLLRAAGRRERVAGANETSPLSSSVDRYLALLSKVRVPAEYLQPETNTRASGKGFSTVGLDAEADYPTVPLRVTSSSPEVWQPLAGRISKESWRTFDLFADALTKT